MGTPLKLVVLDAEPAFGSSAASEGESLEEGSGPLAACGELEVYDHTGPDELLPRARGAQVLLTNKVVLARKDLEKLPDLRLISVLATGVNVVDVAGANDLGITVCNVPGYSTMSTAQHTIALLLELTNHVGLHARDVAEGGWEKAQAFSYFRAPLSELDGLTLGVVGYGAIGQQVAHIGAALGMKVIVHTRTRRSESEVTFVDKATLLAESDVLSLHCPLTEETHHFIDKDALQKMKRSALLLNVARGPVVDEAALADALTSGRIGGAATDVLSSEPPDSENPLLRAPRCIITPHIAWASVAARARLIKISADNIRAFFSGNPQNVVTP